MRPKLLQTTNRKSCFVSNDAILDDLGARFKVKPGDDNLPPMKRKFSKILALAEVCSL